MSYGKGLFLKVLCFIGLTIYPEEAMEFLDIHYLGPIQAGDIPTAIAEFNPEVIAIIDGLFFHTAAVLHKDILYAINHGITVFGAASIGALRAAELCGYGMIGIGKIFQEYLSGHLSGDDEVAVPVAFSIENKKWTIVNDYDALVNIRATLEKASKQGILDVEPKNKLLNYAKSLSFFERRWSDLMNPQFYGYPNDPFSDLRSNLKDIRVDQKKRDAIALLKRIARFINTHGKASSSPKQIEQNALPVTKGPFWDETQWSRPLTLANEQTEINTTPLLQDLLDYAMLSKGGSSLFSDSLIRTTLIEIASTLGVKGREEDIKNCMEAFINQNGGEPTKLTPLTKGELYKLASDEVACEYLLDYFAEKIQRGVLLTLLSEGQFLRFKDELLSISKSTQSLPKEYDPDLWKYLDSHLKRIGIVNTKDYFERFLSWMPKYRLVHIIRYFFSRFS